MVQERTRGAKRHPYNCVDQNLPAQNGNFAVISTMTDVHSTKKLPVKEYLRDGRAPIPESAVTSKVMSANKAKNTKPEISLRTALRDVGIKGYRLNWKKVPGKPDIAFPGRRVAIFVHGCFWHRCPYCNYKLPKSNSLFWRDKFARNIERDAKKMEQLQQIGWQTIVVWECEIKNNIWTIVEKLKKIIEI